MGIFQTTTNKLKQTKAFLRKKWENREQPINIWKDSDEPHVCLNCGKEYQGNFCPRCGQSGKTERFTMKSVFTNTLEVWGFGNRGFVRNLIELLYRPGYMIRDYLQCRRQAYFQPVKMLFILCVLYALVLHFFHKRFTVVSIRNGNRPSSLKIKFLKTTSMNTLSSTPMIQIRKRN